MKTNIQKFNIGIIGSSYVGKCSIAERFTKDQFSEEKKNIIFETYDKTFEINGIQVYLNIVTIMGTKDCSNIRDMLFSKFDGFIFVYDMNNDKSLKRTFKMFKSGLSVVHEECTKSLPCVLAANKSDLVTDEANRHIILERGRAIASQMKCELIETSSKTSLNINELFIEITEILIKERERKMKGNCQIC